jgi:hypothetical protein
MADKIADGWVYERKDEMLKTHHCIVAFEKLPNSTEKDALFVNIVNTLK